MEQFVKVIGATMLLLGGLGLSAIITGFVFGLAADMWRTASYKWRGILSGESFIWEYRKNREQYMKWRESNNG